MAKTFPLKAVHEVLAASGKTSQRERDLPAHVVVYYVIALALYMHASSREVLRCLLEGLQWLSGPLASIKVTGKSGISQARAQLGWEALGRLHDQLVRPIPTPATRGAWYKHWRLVSLDGSTLDVADDPASPGPTQTCSVGPGPWVPSLDAAFGRPGASHGARAFGTSASSPWWRKRHSCPVRHQNGRLHDERDRLEPERSAQP